jgi:hypothetical protein
MIDGHLSEGHSGAFLRERHRAGMARTDDGCPVALRQMAALNRLALRVQLILQ